MGGKPATTTNDEITGRVMQVVSDERNKPSDKPMGVVFGEAHNNAEFPRLLANSILPAIAAQAGDQPKVLQLEWKNTPENNADLKEFMKTGDPAVRDRLIARNIDLPGERPEDVQNNRDVRAAWGQALDSARANNFQVNMYDDPKVSIKALFNQRAQEMGVEPKDLPKAERDALEEKRVEVANPVMVDNIKSTTPAGGIAIVVVGDDHARRANDLPEQLGYSYIKATESGDRPGVLPNQDGSKLNISLTDRGITSLQSGVVAENDAKLAAVILRDVRAPEGLDGDGQKFASGLVDKMHDAAKKIDGGDMTGAQVQLDEVSRALHERYTDEQIKNDAYLSRLDDITKASEAVVNKELEKGPQQPAPAAARAPPVAPAPANAPRPPQA